MTHCVGSFPGAKEAFFSSDNRLFAMPIGAGVQVYDLNRRDASVRLKGHTEAIHGLCFSMDGASIATGSVDRSARCWDANTGEELRKLDQHRFYVDDVTFGENGSQLISATRGGPFNMWDVSTGLEINRFREPTRCSGGMARIARSANSSLLAVVENNGGGSYIDIWDIKSGTKSHTFESENSYLHAIFLAESQFLAVVDTVRGKIEIWNVMNWEQIETIKFVPDEGVFARWTHVSASKDGNLLAIAVNKSPYFLIYPSRLPQTATFSSSNTVDWSPGIAEQNARLADLGPSFAPDLWELNVPPACQTPSRIASKSDYQG